jgi:Uma2 family endonuclease
MSTMSEPVASWHVDPEDPRAPPEEVWEQLSQAQRQQVLDSLPSEFPVSESAPPEGDLHTEAVYGARTALRRFFERTGRGIYVGTNLPVYYPGRAMFSPDVMAVLDVATHPRPSWVVSKEGKGLDFAMEVIVLGHRHKDTVRNLELYARLGIREYFIFDRPKLRLTAYRLRDSVSGYAPILPQAGRYASEVLQLELQVQGERLHFFAGDAELPGADALIERLEGFANDLEARLSEAEQRAESEAQRAESEAQRAESEAQRAESEAQRARDAEARLAAALAELEALKRG